MAIEPTYILYGVIFLTVLLLVEGAYYFFVDSTLTKRRANRRLTMLGAGMESREVLELLRRRPSRHGQSVSPLLHPVAYLENLIAQSGMQVTPRRILLIMAVVAVVTVLGLQVALAAGRLPVPLAPVHIQAAFALLVGLLLPPLYLSYRAAARKRRFGDQLPDALDIMVRSLKAGHPINAAMGLVAREMSDPMGTEFGIMVDEMTYGLEMDEALENLSDRVQVEDFNYVVMSIGIQRETGGNLAGVLAGLSHVIRERARMFLKVRSLSSEGRMSALVLCILPFVVGGMIFTANPGYFTKVIDDPLFLPLLSMAFVDLLLGIFIIHRMVNFRV
ncbi:MAG: type II secretion system protein F [Kiloniellaceae bacterium]|nr:type II secretion system protein F [Kiloniellaceae bacterium]